MNQVHKNKEKKETIWLDICDEHTYNYEWAKHSQIKKKVRLRICDLHRYKWIEHSKIKRKKRFIFVSVARIIINDRRHSESRKKKKEFDFVSMTHRVINQSNALKRI